MAEICIECFLLQYPELKKDDLVLYDDLDLCEACGKMKINTVIKIKHDK